MENKLLLVVDMQNDFISGALGSAQAQAIVENVCKKIDGWNGRVCFTLDTHEANYAETLEGKRIPVPHCINGTWGHKLHEDIAASKALFVERTDPIINGTPGSCTCMTVYKPTFGYTGFADDFPKLMNFDSIEIVGLCTDVCVISNAMILRAAYPDIPITVDASCCAGVTPEGHLNALAAMKVCCIDIVGEEV